MLLLAELTARPDSDAAVEAILRDLVRSTAQEPGNRAYAVHRRRDVPHGFIVYELYRDDAASSAHLASPPLQAALARFETLLAVPPRLVQGDLLAAAGLAD